MAFQMEAWVHGRMLCCVLCLYLTDEAGGCPASTGTVASKRPITSVYSLVALKGEMQ